MVLHVNELFAKRTASCSKPKPWLSSVHEQSHAAAVLVCGVQVQHIGCDHGQVSTLYEPPPSHLGIRQSEYSHTPRTCRMS